MYYSDEKTKIGRRYLDIVVVLLFINMAFMISDYKVICNKVGVVCSLLILFYIIIGSKDRFVLNNTYEPKVIKSIFLFLIYYTLTSLFNYSFSRYFEAIAYYLIEFLPLFLCINILKKANRSVIRSILVSFFIIWNVFCIIGFVYFSSAPDLARLMASNRTAYYSTAIGGGYPMAYGSAILSVFLFECLINGRFDKRKIRFYVVLELILMLLLIYSIHSFIIFICTVLGFGLCLAKRTAKGSLVVVLMIIIVIVTVLLFNTETILTYLLKSTSSNFWKARWEELYYLLVLNEASYHIGLRTYLYDLSWQTFLRHPLFGVGYTYGNYSGLAIANGVGDHSSILDALAQYGITGSVPLFVLCSYPYRYNKQNQNSSIYLVTFYLMLLLNPVFSIYHTMLIVFLIIPLIQYSIRNRDIDV